MAHNAELTQCWIDQNGIDFYADVALVLGRTTTDEGRLCSDNADGNDPGGKINKWAKFKPVRFYGLSISSTQRKVNAHYGFDVNAIYANTMGGIYASAISNLGDWPYLPPRDIEGGNEPFRILDFTDSDVANNGYKSSAYRDGQNRAIAICPIEQGGPWSALRFRNLNYTEIQVKDVISGADYSYFKNDQDFASAHLYLLYRYAGSVKIQPGYYVEDGVHIPALYSDLLAGKDINFENTPIYNTKQIAVLSNCPDIGSLDAVDPENDNSYEWLFLPNTYKVIPQDNLYVSWSHVYTPSAQSGSGEPNVNISLFVDNKYIGSQSTVTVRVDSVRVQGEDSTEYDTYSDPAGDVIVLSYGESGTIEINFDLDNPNYTPGERLLCELTYTVTRRYGTTTETEQKTVVIFDNETYR